MEIKPIAHLHSPFGSKFGVPRQSGLVSKLRGEVVFEPEFRDPNALRGIEGFEYLWLIWGFSEVEEGLGGPTVRPPRLGGNEAVGVFASRSPFRPNRLGLSSVKLESVESDPKNGHVLRVSGADLMDGTPIYDIKPYIPYSDSHPEARAGFVDTKPWKKLKVNFPGDLRDSFLMLSSEAKFSLSGHLHDTDELQALVQTLSLDPRPRYKDEPEKVYGMIFGGVDVKFSVCGDTLTVIGVELPTKKGRL